MSPVEILGPMNPSSEFTYSFVSKLFQEIKQVFPDNYFHMGGDEVDLDCWKSNRNLSEFMKEHSLGNDYRALQNHYIMKVLPAVIEGTQKKTAILWQEIFDDGAELPTDRVIAHVWKRDSWQLELARLTARGIRVLYSAPFYFNLIHYGADWQDAYFQNPLEFEGTAQQKALLLGGEACMWSEFVDNSNLISRSWPRVAAFAERFWSNPAVINLESTRSRLEEHRCRMIRRGLIAQPISGPGFCDQEPPPHVPDQSYLL